MGKSLDRTTDFMYRHRLARYSDIVRDAGSAWGLNAHLGLPSQIHPLESGLYAITDDHFGPHSQAARKVPRGVLCLASALWAHGLLEREPHPVQMAIASRARTPRFKNPAVRYFRMLPRLLEKGVLEQNIDGIPVNVFNLPRTPVDCHRFRRQIGPDLAEQALEAAMLKGWVAPQGLLHAAREARALTWMNRWLRARCDDPRYPFRLSKRRRRRKPTLQAIDPEPS